MEKTRKILKEVKSNKRDSETTELQEQRNSSLLADVIDGFQDKKIKAHDTISEKSGEGTAELFRKSLTELGKRMELTNDEQNALSRFRKLFNDVDRMGAGGIKNNVNKIADRLGLSTQTSF